LGVPGPAVSLTGRLVDTATRVPLKAALVGSPGIGDFSTSEEGRFTLPHMPAGQIFLYTQPRPFPPGPTSVHSVTLPPGQDTDLGDIAVHTP
jgi:hypothetical protein